MGMPGIEPSWLCASKAPNYLSCHYHILGTEPLAGQAEYPDEWAPVFWSINEWTKKLKGHIVDRSRLVSVESSRGWRNMVTPSEHMGCFGRQGLGVKDSKHAVRTHLYHRTARFPGWMKRYSRGGRKPLKIHSVIRNVPGCLQFTHLWMQNVRLVIPLPELWKWDGERSLDHTHSAQNLLWASLEDICNAKYLTLVGHKQGKWLTHCTVSPAQHLKYLLLGEVFFSGA